MSRKKKTEVVTDDDKIAEAVLGTIDTLVPDESIPTTEPSEPEEVVPDINSLEWTPYVMKQLTDEEVINGAPTVDGLRRITHEVLGEVIESTSRIVQAPTVQNGNHAAVEHHIVIKCRTYDDDVKFKRYSGCADVYPGNTNVEYARFSCATAETRAEGRALRKALRLRNICAAEELTDVPIENSGASGFIVDNQLNLINNVCKRCDINVMELFKHCKAKHNYKEAWGDVTRIPYAAAQQIVADVSEFQRKEETVPPNIKGFKPDWRPSND